SRRSMLAALALSHYEETIHHYGELLGVKIARKHVSAYLDAAPVDIDPEERRQLRGAICRLWSPARVESALRRFFVGDIGRAFSLAA
ncbi:MAG: hypothetical protein WD076_09560, partial [Parvularculaceae bacterium]